MMKTAKASMQRITETQMRQPGPEQALQLILSHLGHDGPPLLIDLFL